jgi:hypothetical protein
LMQSLEAGLQQLGLADPARLIFSARQKTVGPWKLFVLQGETWSVQGRDAAQVLQNLPKLLHKLDPSLLCRLLSSFAVADDLMRLGKYAACADYLTSQERQHALSREGRCLWLLRVLRVQRRLALHEHASQTMARLQVLSSTIPGVLGLDLQATCELLQARMAFDAAPHFESHRLDFPRLLAHIGNAGSPQLHWEWANLHALSVRRKISTCLQQQDGKGVASQVALGHRLYAAAMYWLVQAQEPYYLQAVASNYAFFLHWLHKRHLHDDVQYALEWFKLAHTYVERFELPQDSAWDFIMVGDLYLQNAETKSAIDQDSLTWPAQHNPTELAFYERSYALAQSHGDVRQQIFALDQLVGFYKLTLQRFKAVPARKQRNALMALHAAVVTDMVRDGFVAQT